MKWVKRSPLGWLCVMQSCVLSLLTSSVVSGEISTSSEIQVAGSATFQASPAVASDAAGNQARPSVAVAPDGRFLVAWQSDQQAGGQGWDVVAQAYNASGSVAGSEVLVNSVTVGGQSLPRAAYLNNPTEGFAVAWEGAGAIFVRRVGVSGPALSGRLDQ